ncbi:TetR family transcriptional regulator [Streptomyces spiroverticillatus]|uniref:TetR family transcriptional regulator n=1 Tax=Streptomyces finlayi TaxID=67296 RepID=A0A919CFX8_9ACTN|nr:TetR/AcrR family transcriptional regulator [Streptomyces finlayi]GHA48657.1 TetR family transcriptional regulator [Streptomyces spiroverticillatus]GHD19023.1 TetR family transcriptional regulator [Streptomyces finlayi]
MSATQGARERARTEITAAIKEEARRQLAVEGAAKLSLRAVARELGMVSSALYRYFPSRDDLLTALITDAYDAVGEAAEKADAEAPDGAGHRERWVQVCLAVREWALAHPQEYALLYGSPVPGYSAPQTTAVPAARAVTVLMAIARDAHGSRGLAVERVPVGLRGEAERLAADIAPDFPPAVAIGFVKVWAELFGLISFEVFGHFHRVVEEREAFFVHAVEGLAGVAGVLGE